MLNDPFPLTLVLYFVYAGSLFSLFSFLFILQEETAYYDEPLYEYAYEYADSTEAEYVEEKAEEALETVPNQISKRRRKRSSPVKR